MNALAKYNNSGKSEFVAVYGRRRVGKTFLISQFYKNFAFETSGIIGGTKKDEMTAFYTSLMLYGYKDKKPRTWMEMFFQRCNNEAGVRKAVLFAVCQPEAI